MIKGYRYLLSAFYKHPILTRLLTIAAVLLILAIGLWPFSFFPPNKVKWLTEKNGVQIYGQGIIFSTAPVWNPAKLLSSNHDMTIELWLHPRQETNNLPSILTLYDGKYPDVFLIGQWKNHLVVRNRLVEKSSRKPGRFYREVGLRNGLPKDRDVFLTVTSRKDRSFIYINGSLAKEYPYHNLLAGLNSRDNRLIIGNSPSGQGFWPGDIKGLAIYNEALSADEVVGNYLYWMQNDPYSLKKGKGLIALYLFYEQEGRIIRNAVDADDTLSIPDIFNPVRRVAFSQPWQGNLKVSLSLVQDAAINILGFIPAGFIFAVFLAAHTAWRRPALCLTAIVLGTGLSFMVEFTQAYLPIRDSSVLDLLYNMAGTIVGVLIFSRHEKEEIISNELCGSQ